MYRITIDRNLCSGFGACAELAPDVFEVDDGGLVSIRVGSSSAPRAVERGGARPRRGGGAPALWGRGSRGAGEGGADRPGRGVGAAAPAGPAARAAETLRVDGY